MEYHIEHSNSHIINDICIIFSMHMCMVLCHFTLALYAFYISESFVLRVSSDSVHGLGHGVHMRSSESSGNQTRQWHASSCVKVEKPPT